MNIISKLGCNASDILFITDMIAGIYGIIDFTSTYNRDTKVDYTNNGKLVKI